MAGIGAEGAYGSAATYAGLQDWMQGRRQKVVQGQQDADRLRSHSIQDQEMAIAQAELARRNARQDVGDQRATTLFDQGQQDRQAGIAADAQSEEGRAALLAEIDKLDLPPLAKIGAKITVQKGGQLPPQIFEMMTPKAPKLQRVETVEGGRPVTKFLPEDQVAGQTFEQYRAPVAAAPREDRIVPVQTVDEKGQPVTKYLPESQVRGQTFAKASTGAGPTLTAPMRKALVDAEVGEKILTQLQGLYEDRPDPKTGQTVKGAKHHIGPAEGRVRSFGQAVGIGGINPTFAEFKAASARLKNATIQAITGASMGVEEAKRIIDEIPTENDPPELWPIKAKQAMQNITNIRAAINAQGGGTTGTADDLLGAGQEFDWVDGKLVPR